MTPFRMLAMELVGAEDSSGSVTCGLARAAVIGVVDVRNNTMHPKSFLSLTPSVPRTTF